jgi:uncharacterized protein (TIGR03437 family)
VSRRATVVSLALLAASFHQWAIAQALPPVILEVDSENLVSYFYDVAAASDPTKIATNPNISPAVLRSSFDRIVGMADIVAVNGKPAKGLVLYWEVGIGASPTPQPGSPIADVTALTMRYITFQILQSNSTPVGTIMTVGLEVPGTTPPPPGAPLAQTSQNMAIVGGTGAFLGARGQQGQERTAQTVTARQASMLEDPAMRRVNGGGKSRYIFQLDPMSRPKVIDTPSGPAVAHSSDFSLVSAAQPAAPGEILSLFATGLGPTRPGIDPGQPFPVSPLAVVNSPVEVTVNGQAAAVLGAVGYPGGIDGYQVNFRVPPDAAKGTATIQVSAAWIPGAPVNITIQ